MPVRCRTGNRGGVFQTVRRMFCSPLSSVNPRQLSAPLAAERMKILGTQDRQIPLSQDRLTHRHPVFTSLADIGTLFVEGIHGAHYT